MKCYSSRTGALLVLLCATVLQFCSAAEPRGWILSGTEDPEQEWPRFKKTFHKHYHDDHEELQRFEIFKVRGAGKLYALDPAKAETGVAAGFDGSRCSTQPHEHPRWRPAGVRRHEVF